MVTIEEIRKLNIYKNIIISGHALNRMEDNQISMDDICSGIDTGKIIEQYPEDYPLPSCLVLGHDCEQNYIHIVLALHQQSIRLITVYRPNNDKWLTGYEIRRK